MNQLNRQYIFIPGLHRCGTSWVSKWLSKHSDIYRHGENYILYNTYHEYKKSKTLKKMRNIVENSFLSINDSAPYFLDKSPAQLFCRKKPRIDIIRKIFPYAYVLCFYKYPPDYIYSLLNLPKWGEKRFTFKKAFKICQQDVKYLTNPRQDERILYLKYEELIDKPIKMSQKIIDFLGITNTLEHLVPWNQPINTIHKKYDRNRWKQMPLEYIEKIKMMNDDIIKLEYKALS